MAKYFMKNKLLHFMISAAQITVYAPEGRVMYVAPPIDSHVMSVQQCSRIIDMLSDKFLNYAVLLFKQESLFNGMDTIGNVTLMNVLNKVLINHVKISTGSDATAINDIMTLVLNVGTKLNPEVFVNPDRFAYQLLKNIIAHKRKEAFLPDTYAAESFICMPNQSEHKISPRELGKVEYARKYLARMQAHIDSLSERYKTIQTIQEHRNLQEELSRCLVRAILDTYNLNQILGILMNSDNEEENQRAVKNGRFLHKITITCLCKYIVLYEIFISDNITRYIDTNNKSNDIDITEYNRQLIIHKKENLNMPIEFVKFIKRDPIISIHDTLLRVIKTVKNIDSTVYDPEVLKDTDDPMHYLQEIIQSYGDNVGLYINNLQICIFRSHVESCFTTNTQSTQEIIGLTPEEKFKIMFTDLHNILHAYELIEKPESQLAKGHLRATIYTYMKNAINMFYDHFSLKAKVI